MATLADIFNQRVANSNLKNRTQAAVANAIWAVFDESAPTQARLDWAIETIANVEGYTDQWFWGVLGNATVQAADPPFDGAVTPGVAQMDTDIQFIINTIRDKIAPA